MADLHHIESEQAVIGSLLIDPNAFDKIDFLKESDFYVGWHQVIYRHISALVSERKPVDPITVAESLVSAGINENEIGLAYLGKLASEVPSSSRIVHYAKIVSDRKKRRDLLDASNRIADIAQRDGSECAEARIDEAERVMFGLAESCASDEREPEMAGAVLAEVIEELQRRVDADGAIVGLSTGFDDLDEKTCGLSGGDLVIVAGRPAMGKTTLAINVAEHVAINNGKTVLVFSMEMNRNQLVERTLSSVGAIPMQNIRSGKMTDDDYSRLTLSMGKVHTAPLVIDDRPALSIAKMHARARRVARKHGLALIVVDYIQLAVGDGNNREQEVSSISRGLKAMAKEFNVPVIALSQLSRKVEERADKRPMMSDLRESGAIEQDADIILLMYRDDYYHPESPEKGIAEIIIGKQRMGETGTVKVLFQGQYSRFRNLSADAKESLYLAAKEAREERQKSKPMRKGFSL